MYFPERLRVLIAWILSMPPMAWMYLATISSTVCATAGTANIARPARVSRILRILISLENERHCGDERLCRRRGFWPIALEVVNAEPAECGKSGDQHAGIHASPEDSGC